MTADPKPVPFGDLGLRRARDHALSGGVALHLRRLGGSRVWTGLLVDGDEARLGRMARRFGVDALAVGRDESPACHVHLEGEALDRAIAACDQPDCDPDDPDFGDRAGGGCPCPDCGRPFHDHPAYWKLLSNDGEPFLTLLCGGRVVKL